MHPLVWLWKVRRRTEAGFLEPLKENDGPIRESRHHTCRQTRLRLSRSISRNAPRPLGEEKSDCPGQKVSRNVATEQTDQTAPPTILVIDDEADIRGLLRLALEEAGYRVLESCDGEEGLAMAKRERCALAIVDLFMPGKEGLETIFAFRRDMPAVKLMAMSGGSGHTDMLPVASSFGADGTIQKPFELDTLLATIAALLDTP